MDGLSSLISFYIPAICARLLAFCKFVQPVKGQVLSVTKSVWARLNTSVFYFHTGGIQCITSYVYDFSLSCAVCNFGGYLEKVFTTRSAFRRQHSLI